MNSQVQLPVARPGGPSSLDAVAEEVPVAFEYNGISHTVMLATPADLEDFALGFSLTEGIVGKRSEVFGIEVEEAEVGITLHLDIAGGASPDSRSAAAAWPDAPAAACAGGKPDAGRARSAAGARGQAILLAALYEGMCRLPAQQRCNRPPAPCMQRAGCW